MTTYAVACMDPWTDTFSGGVGFDSIAEAVLHIRQYSGRALQTLYAVENGKSRDLTPAEKAEVEKPIPILEDLVRLRREQERALQLLQERERVSRLEGKEQIPQLKARA
jgi:hypothetical protein